MVTFQKRYQENTKLQSICKFIADVMIVILLAYTLITFTCFRTTVIGSSMNSAIESNDTVLINKFSYNIGGPGRMDVIAFQLDAIKDSKIYVKRVVGLPGETIQIKDGKVYINGSELADDVSTDNILTAGIASNELTLGEDEYFVLGDNRNNSEDSRFATVGVINQDEIIGRAWMIMSPISHMKLL